MYASWDSKGSVKHMSCSLTACSFCNFSFCTWGLDICYFIGKKAFYIIYFTSMVKIFKPPTPEEALKFRSLCRGKQVSFDVHTFSIFPLSWLFSIALSFAGVFWSMDLRIWCMDFVWHSLSILLSMLTSVEKVFSWKFIYTFSKSLLSWRSI